ncbi:hypothetical protein QBC38DRAFT_490413 [Podospora fimiseda]|uniref:Uncharacterized protein n=1 Tax=Podospora fimiseda TaxID=252190 RepID=A0AAN6YPE8_9PEZI|nr:hypothetical protein QBC38DRAFT_490413 [Podospora fimiseda]
MSNPESPGTLVPSPITDVLLRAVYNADQAMYPVPLPDNRLRDWVSACPDLSMCFHSPKQGLMGVVIVLPLLRRHWEDLLSGKLKEFDIDPRTMFPDMTATLPHQRNRKPEQVGLHVYHIERLAVEPPTPNQRRFSEVAMEEVTRRAEDIWHWEVIGMSALTATGAGKNTFQRMGFKPTGYREVFVSKKRPTSPTRATFGEEEFGTEGSEVEMLCIYPDEEGDVVRSVSDIIPYGHTLVSMTEMTVKHVEKLNNSIEEV